MTDKTNELIKTPVRYFPPFSEIVDADDEPILRVYGAGMEKRNLIGPEIAKAINGYDHAAAELRWIPVKTRYPDRSGIYDVTLCDGTISKSAYYVGAFDKSVIAWMPMPTKPYTEPADNIEKLHVIDHATGNCNLGCCQGEQV